MTQFNEFGVKSRCTIVFTQNLDKLRDNYPKTYKRHIIPEMTKITKSLPLIKARTKGKEAH